MLREIKSTQRLPRQLAFKITGTGTEAINIGGFDATLADNGTGDYPITFSKPFARTSWQASLISEIFAPAFAAANPAFCDS